MYYYTCFYRHRDNSGKIIGYTLRNEQTFEWMQVTPEQLKDAIYNNRVHIFNLKLTSDGRIIEAKNQAQNFNTQKQASYTGVTIRNDTDDLGYTQNIHRKEILDHRIKPDASFTKNGFFRFLKDSFDRWNYPKKYSNINDDRDAAYKADFSYDSGHFDGGSYEE